MKTTKKTSTKSGMFQPGEHIRVVPLHHPKPSLPIDEMGRQREEEEHDLFDGKPHVAAATAHLTYNGGPLIPHVTVFTLFWGRKWGVVPSSKPMMNNLNTFFSVILTSPAITQLQEYNVPGQTIGHGSFIGTKVITVDAPARSVTDSVIQTRLKKWISSQAIVKNTANTLYFIYLDPGIVSILGDRKSVV